MKKRDKFAIKILLLIIRIVLGYSLNGETQKRFEELEKEIKDLDEN